MNRYLFQKFHILYFQLPSRIKFSWKNNTAIFNLGFFLFYCHSTRSCCISRRGLDRASYMCSSTWRPCCLDSRIKPLNTYHFMVSEAGSFWTFKLQLHMELFKWKQPDLLRHFVKYFKFQRSTRSTRFTAIFKFQVSSFKSIHVQALTVYLSLNNSHGKIYNSFNGLVDTWRYPQAI